MDNGDDLMKPLVLCILDGVGIREEIKGNAFMNCERAAVLVEPNVKKFAGPVHKNILIENNLFVLNETNATDISYAHNVTIKENTYGGDAKNGVFSVCDNVSAFVTDKP